jgi:lipopolysaccharide export system permease protein
LRLLDRYVLGQLLRPMGAILVVALVALLADRSLQVIDLVLGQHGSLFLILEMLGYLVPIYLSIALPASLMVAILLTVARLSRDGELDAILASGEGLGAVLRPLLLAALLLAGVNAAVQSHLQPWSRYGYRVAAGALASVSLQALLRPGAFITVGETTYWVDALDRDGASFRGLFLATAQAGGGILTLTAERGRMVPGAGGAPAVLELENGVQQLAPPPGSAGPATIARFRRSATDLKGGTPEPLQPRGRDEREMTLPELWSSPGDPARGIRPEEVAAELHVRLARIAAMLILPLVAAPLAIARRRSRRSYGFVAGVGLLLVFHQLVQLGKSLADDGKLSVLVGIWAPLAAFAAIGLGLSLAKATRIPAGGEATRLERAIEALAGRLVRALGPRRQGT